MSIDWAWAVASGVILLLGVGGGVAAITDMLRIGHGDPIDAVEVACIVGAALATLGMLILGMAALMAAVGA